MSRVIHFEIPADDPARAVAFYEKVFGWTTTSWEGPGEYWLVKTGEEGRPGIDGGITRRRAEGEPVRNTIGVASVDDAVAAIEGAGGTIAMPKSPIPGVGWLAMAVDPEGNPFAVMQPDPDAA